MLGLEKVKALTTQVQALRKREGILDGQTHIGHSQLGFHRSVLELYGRMYNRLWVNEHLDLLGIHTEEPFGFDDLEALVHHRS